MDRGRNDKLTCPARSASYELPDALVRAAAPDAAGSARANVLELIDFRFG